MKRLWRALVAWWKRPLLYAEFAADHNFWRVHMKDCFARGGPVPINMTINWTGPEALLPRDWAEPPRKPHLWPRPASPEVARMMIDLRDAQKPLVHVPIERERMRQFKALAFPNHPIIPRKTLVFDDRSLLEERPLHACGCPAERTYGGMTKAEMEYMFHHG